MDAKKFKEPLPENERPINQLSKKAIKSLKESPDPSYLYWLQLVRLCLERGDLYLERPEFLPFLDILDRLKPKEAQNFLELCPDDGEEYEVADPKKNWEPQELAARILDHLEGNVAASNLGYPKPIDDLP